MYLEEGHNLTEVLNVSRERCNEMNKKAANMCEKLVFENNKQGYSQIKSIVEAMNPQTSEELSYCFFCLTPLLERIEKWKTNPTETYIDSKLRGRGEDRGNDFNPSNKN